MSRRRKRDDDWIGLVAQLAVVLFLLSLISPEVRHVISALGFIAICLLIIAVVGLIGFGVYKWSTHSRGVYGTHDLLASIPLADVPSVQLHRIEATTMLEGTLPQTTADLVEQLRSIDWFQFEKLVCLAYQKLGYTVTRRGGANSSSRSS